MTRLTLIQGTIADTRSSSRKNSTRRLELVAWSDPGGRDHSRRSRAASYSAAIFAALVGGSLMLLQAKVGSELTPIPLSEIISRDVTSGS